VLPCRPHLHIFFTSVYEDYDIVIWSANSLKWMNVKMKALGVLGNESYKVAFMLDFKSMVTVHTQKRGANPIA
jgi:ubiquitin-like domain-containing CTD phosphatase 1